MLWLEQSLCRKGIERFMCSLCNLYFSFHNFLITVNISSIHDASPENDQRCSVDHTTVFLQTSVGRRPISSYFPSPHFISSVPQSSITSVNAPPTHVLMCKLS